MNLDYLLALDLPAPLVWCALAWLFALGACVGSFMNVVIYRLPAGQSLLHPASRCPACETPIRAFDNVPIFGWLWLRGRCRQCRAAISARYPLVELLVALVFVVLAWYEPLALGDNLPAGQSKLSAGDLWGRYAYHLFLLCSLICAAFTEYDCHRLRWRLIVPAFMVGLAAPLAWPSLRPVAGQITNQVWLNTLADELLVAAAGAAVGWAVWLVTCIVGPSRAGQGRDPAWHSGVALAWIGVFLGWQAAVCLALVNVATLGLAAGVGRFMPSVRRIGSISYLALGAMVWILAWKPLLAWLC
jgi:leader peptidase (prepilin peptidase) / N-methyltransferase